MKGRSVLMRRKREEKAFTLIELMVVVLIIGMLAWFVAPRAFKGLSKAQKSIARSKMSNIENALANFRLDCGRFPTQDEGLEALLFKPDDLEENKWDNPYLKRSELLDPWEHPYIYVAEGERNPGSFDLISLGADGEPDGEGDNEDIYND